MAMLQRDEPPSRKRYGGPGALLEYAVMHNDEAEADRLRAELRRLTGFCDQRIVFRYQ